MQCRICLEDGGDGVTPCQCRGTAAFIHTTCLERYIQYYPDRICRVCNGRFPGDIVPSRDREMVMSILAVTFFTLLFSNALLIAKIALFGAISGILAFYSERNLLGGTPMVFLGILSMLFLPGVQSTVAYLWMAVLGGIATLYTVSYYVPAIFLLGIVVTLFLALYVGMLTYAAYHALDSFAFTIYLFVLYLVWYGWIRERPPPRLRLA